MPGPVKSLFGVAGANASLKDAGGGGTPERVAVGNGLLYYEKDTVTGGVDMCVVGNHLYILGADLKRYDFSSNWNVTGTMTLHSSYTVPTGSQGIHVSSDETTFFLARTAGTVTRYSMSTAGDLSTATPTGDFLSTGDNLRGLIFNSVLTKFFVASSAGTIDEYDLSPAGDVSTGTLANSVSSEAAHYGLYLSEDEDRILAGDFTDKIREYSLPTPGTLSGGLTLESTLDTRDQIGRGACAVQEPTGRILITGDNNARLNFYSTWGVTSGDEVFVSSTPEPT